MVRKLGTYTSVHATEVVILPANKWAKPCLVLIKKILSCKPPIYLSNRIFWLFCFHHRTISYKVVIADEHLLFELSHQKKRKETLHTPKYQWLYRRIKTKSLCEPVNLTLFTPSNTFSAYFLQGEFSCIITRLYQLNVLLSLHIFIALSYMVPTWSDLCKSILSFVGTNFLVKWGHYITEAGFTKNFAACVRSALSTQRLWKWPKRYSWRGPADLHGEKEKYSKKLLEKTGLPSFLTLSEVFSSPIPPKARAFLFLDAAHFRPSMSALQANSCSTCSSRVWSFSIVWQLQQRLVRIASVT